MGHVARKPDFVACEEQRHGLVTNQSAHLFSYSVSGKYNSLTCHVKILHFLASYDRFSQIEAHHLT